MDPPDHLPQSSTRTRAGPRVSGGCHLARPSPDLALRPSSLRPNQAAPLLHAHGRAQQRRPPPSPSMVVVKPYVRGMTAFSGEMLGAIGQATSGHFWILRQDGDEEDDSDAGESSASLEDLHGFSMDPNYLAEVPPVSDRDLRSTSSSRGSKRMEKRRLQREAAITLWSQVSSSSSSVSSCRSTTPWTKASIAWSKRPVLEPSTFCLDDKLESAAWTVVQHRKKKDVHRWGRICRNGRRRTSPAKVIHRAASLIHLWSYLLPVEQREPLDTGCNRLMAVVRAIFSQGGWLQSRRIGDGT